MKYLRASLLSLGLMLCLVQSRADAGFITFFDGTFDDADWERDVFEHINGGTVSASQVLSGGNPDEYFHVVNTVSCGGVDSAVYGLYLKPTASYTPSVHG